MSTARKDIKDWPRGTTPPFRISVSANGEKRSLVGCTLAMVVREDEWHDSMTDDIAVMKRRVSFYSVDKRIDLSSISNPKINDMAWVVADNVPVEYDGQRWREKDPQENAIIDGVYTIRFTRNEAMIPVETYHYSIDIKFENGEVVKIVRGKINITPNTVNEI